MESVIGFVRIFKEILRAGFYEIRKGNVSKLYPNFGPFFSVCGQKFKFFKSLFTGEMVVEVDCSLQVSRLSISCSIPEIFVIGV